MTYKTSWDNYDQDIVGDLKRLNEDAVRDVWYRPWVSGQMERMIRLQHQRIEFDVIAHLKAGYSFWDLEIAHPPFSGAPFVRPRDPEKEPGVWE